MSTAADRFHAHLDECRQCRNNPFDLCPKGIGLLRATAPVDSPKEQPCCDLDTDGDGDCPVHERPGVLRAKTVVDQIVKQERERTERVFAQRDEFRGKLRNSARPSQWSYCPFCGAEIPGPGRHGEKCPGDAMQRWWAEKKYDHPGKARDDVELQLAQDRTVYGTSFEMKTIDGEKKRLDPRTVIIKSASIYNVKTIPDEVRHEFTGEQGECVHCGESQSRHSYGKFCGARMRKTCRCSEGHSFPEGTELDRHNQAWCPECNAHVYLVLEADGGKL